MTGVAIALAILSFSLVADYGRLKHRWPICVIAGLFITGFAALAGWTLETMVRILI